MKKAFKDTAIGGFLGKVAPAVLDTVGEAFPPVKVLASLFDHELQVSGEDQKRFDELLAQYENEELKLYLADVADARDMQKTALGQEDVFSKRFIYWLTAGSLLLGFAYIFVITFLTIPEQNQRFADTILGVVISIIFGTIYNFYFGSSKGSKEKQDIITNKIKND